MFFISSATSLVGASIALTTLYPPPPGAPQCANAFLYLLASSAFDQARQADQSAETSLSASISPDLDHIDASLSENAPGTDTQQENGVLVAQEASQIDGNTEELDRVVITGHRTDSNLQKSAASVSEVSGEQLEQNAVPDVTTLIQSIPGVSLKTEGVGQTEVEMRGMTSSGGSSPTTGFYFDDIALTPPAGAQNGKVVVSPSLFDLRSIDVQRGPQGTLDGAGSMGGSIKLISAPPDPSGFSASLQSVLSETQGGGFNHTDNAMANFALVPGNMALRLVVGESYTSGWIDRIVAAPFPMATNGGGSRGDVAAASVLMSFPNSNASQQYNMRVSLLWKVTPQLTITPELSYLTSSQAGISAYDSTPGTETHYQPFNIPEPLTDRILIASLRAKYQFDHADLTSITAYWDRRSTQVEDGSEDFNNPATGATLASEKNPTGPQPGYYGAGGTGTVVGTESDPSRQISQEIRLSSKTEGPLEWVVGAYASDYTATWNFSGITSNPSVYMDLGATQPANTNQWFVAHSPTSETQFALFGNATYALDPHWKIEGGVRIYRYDYDFSSTITGWGSGLGAASPSSSGLISEQEVGILPRIGLSYDISQSAMVYSDVAKGYRPGGGNALYPTTGIFWAPAYAPLHFCCGWPSTYKPDDVWTYEVGEKARFYDGRVIFDASVYYENWAHPQLLAYPGDWAFNINGNKAQIEGAELSSRIELGGGFALNATLGYTHDYVDPGEHWEISPAHVMPDVPLFNGNLSLTYRRGMGNGDFVSAEVNNGYVGARYSLNFLLPYQSTGEYLKLGSYDLTNLRVGFDSHSGWGVSLFVNNLFNKQAALENLFQETEPSAAFSRVLTNQPRTVGVNMRYDL